jgi:hypothetical protein
MELVDGHLIQECASYEQVVFGVVAICDCSANFCSANASKCDEDGCAPRTIFPEVDGSGTGRSGQQADGGDGELHDIGRVSGKDVRRLLLLLWLKANEMLVR